MNIEEYKKIYDLIIELSCDTEGFNLSNPTPEEQEKAVLISIIAGCLNDVPMGRYNFFKERNLITIDEKQYFNSLFEQ